MLVRWIIAAVRSLGHSTDDLDIIEGLDITLCALRSMPPRVCAVTEFYAGIFDQESYQAPVKLIEPEAHFKNLVKSGMAVYKGKDPTWRQP